jgi:predicted outer membrane lipoprotein
MLFSRLINFEPGYLYGLVCGVVFTRQLPTNEKGHLAALGILTALVVSVVAWTIWIPVNAAALHANPFVGVVLADDLLGALFVGGLVGSFFGMIPIKGLPGWSIKQWNVWAWVAGFAISILGLFQILLRPGIAGHGHRPLIISVILFVAFGVGSILFHEHFESKERRTLGVATPPFKDRVRDVVGLSTTRIAEVPVSAPVTSDREPPT